jgi:hypothetical protein
VLAPVVLAEVLVLPVVPDVELPPPPAALPEDVAADVPLVAVLPVPDPPVLLEPALLEPPVPEPTVPPVLEAGPAAGALTAPVVPVALPVPAPALATLLMPEPAMGALPVPELALPVGPIDRTLPPGDRWFGR